MKELDVRGVTGALTRSGVPSAIPRVAGSPSRTATVPEPITDTTFERLLRSLTAIAPAIAAAAGASASAPAAHDEGVIRTVGAGFTGAFRALDLVVAAPWMLVPVGTRALRAGLASALVAGVCGALAFDLARSLTRAVVPAVLSRLGVGTKQAPTPVLLSAVAAASVLSALLGPAWQAEASAPGGAVTGALLVLLALRLTDEVTPARSGGWDVGAGLAVLSGLAVSYDALVLLAIVGAVAPSAIARLATARRNAKLTEARAPERGSPWPGLAIAFVLGLTPLAIGALLSLRAPEISTFGSSSAWLPKAVRPVRLEAFAVAEVGRAALAVGVGGAVLSLFAARARRRVTSFLLVLVVGAMAIASGGHAGPTRFAPALLAALLVLHIVGGVTLGLLVLAIARARVPFAEASAALVVLLELVLPIQALDETQAGRGARAPDAAEIWNDMAWGSLPPAAVVLVAERSTMRRIASTRASGALRPDLLFVPQFDVQGRAGQHALLEEPKLAPLYRDLALGLPPEELSLAELGAQRPVLATFDPRWDRALARHLVPQGLSSRFEPEPRGASDRKKAMDAFGAAKDQLVRVSVAKRDPELAAATAQLLRARAIGMAATGEREILSQALDDLRAFAPDDRTSAVLVRRLVTTKGPIDVHDLAL